MKNRKLTALLLMAFTANGAFACISDRDSDTLANEGKQLPDIVRIVTGRFERNPPLYFQMRIARVAKELQKDPANLPLYDDIAVAYDRLGKGDEAITWMNRKKLQLAKSSTRSPQKTEATYRYYANCGTFWAHRWLRNGANRSRIAEMKTARDMIAQAITIKPNAHFGREKYQLMIMNWILDPRVKNDNGSQVSASLGDYISSKLPSDDSTQTKGLSGIIVLGNAWESVDVFHALSGALEEKEKPTLQYLTILRTRELIFKGKKSLQPGSKSGSALEKQLFIDKAFLNSPNSLSVSPQNQTAIETVYKRLRTEAETWQTRRTNYMLTRLKAGQHPDTDKTFWRDWRDTPPPSLDVAWYSERAVRHNEENLLFLILKLIGIGLFLIPLSLHIGWKRLVAHHRRVHPEWFV